MAAGAPRRIPIFPLAGAILFPRAQLPLHIFEPRYREMVRDAMAGEQLIGVGSSRVDLQACKLEYSIVSPK